MTVKSQAKQPENALKSVLREIRELRKDLFMSSTPENLDEFAHPARIKKAYLKAVKKYPPNFR